jgi:hypothetical protein
MYSSTIVHIMDYNIEPLHIMPTSARMALALNN